MEKDNIDYSNIHYNSALFDKISKKREEEFEKLRILLDTTDSFRISSYDTEEERKLSSSQVLEPVKPKGYTIEEILLEFKEVQDLEPEPKYVKIEKQVAKQEVIDYDHTEIKGKKTFRNLILFLRKALKEDWNNFKRYGSDEQFEIITNIAGTILICSLIGCGIHFIATHTNTTFSKSTTYENYAWWARKNGIVMNEESFEQYRRDELGIEYEEIEEGYSRGGK